MDGRLHGLRLRRSGRVRRRQGSGSALPAGEEQQGVQPSSDIAHGECFQRCSTLRSHR